MTEPLVAIIGRPNVGKSTLFNRLVGKKLALVDDRPGVTRDRREGEARLGDLSFRIVDTAGLEKADEATLTGRMRQQTEKAIAEADVVLFLVDARAGLLPADEEIADLVRRADKPIVLVANKAEGGKGTGGTLECYGLGLGDPLPFSAEHGEGLADLYDALVDAFAARGFVRDEPQDEDDFGEEADDAEADDAPDRPIRIAVVGRPNAGKSTLINSMLGEERLLTGPEAGITRDSIGLDWAWRGRPFKVFDTAGLRKRARIEDKLEKLSAADALRAVRFAEVVVVLLDATIPFETQDLTIADLVEREGRAVVIALNKWDLVEDRAARLKELREDADRLLPQIKGTPVVTVEAVSGKGIERLMQAVLAAHEVWNRRVSTAKLNRWFEEVKERHPPPAVAGRRIKLRYITQAKARPPHFVVFGNQLDALPKSYTRYLVNGLRETFEMPGTPIRLSLREPRNPFDKGK